MEWLEKFKAVGILRKILSSVYMPFACAALVLACYYLSLDMVAIWALGLCAAAIMLTCRDVTPVFSVFLLANVFTSLKNSPSLNFGEQSGYYSSPANLTQLIIVLVLIFGALAARVTESVVKRRIKLTPTFWTLGAFCIALLLNGVFSSGYTVMNFVYGLFLTAVFCGMFLFGIGNITIEENTFKKLATAFTALLAVVAVQLVTAYATYDGLVIRGEVVRSKLIFGWGTYNQMGMLLTMCIPAPFYLAAKIKHGWAFTFLGAGALTLAFLSMSRQAWVMGSVIFLVCCVWLLIGKKGKIKLFYALILAAIIITAAVVVGVLHEKVELFFSAFWSGLESGSGRIELWKEGVGKFFHYPVFGSGFFSLYPWVWGKSGFADIIPRMFHNTIVQILASCGLVGIAAYAAHRVQTVIWYFKNINNERTFLALTMAALLLVSLLDNHIFYLLPTAAYAFLLAAYDITAVKKRKQENGQTAQAEI